GYGGIPTDQDIAADPDLQFAKQNGIRKIAIVANHHAALLAKVEMHTVHSAMRANDQRFRRLAFEAFESKLICNQCVWPSPHVRRQQTFGPTAKRRCGRAGWTLGHGCNSVVSASGSANCNWCRCA